MKSPNHIPKFPDELKVEILDRTNGGRVVRRVLEPFRLELGRPWAPLTLTVPADAETDFASIPRFFHRVLPPDGRWAKATVVHDYLYRYAVVSRLLADVLFVEGMRALGVGRVRRQLMFWAVRLFGGAAYQGRSA